MVLPILCLLAVAVFAQDASLTLAGSVVDAQTGEPLKRSLVVVQGFSLPKTTSAGSIPLEISRTTLTDGSGGFRFSGLPTARYMVRAQKPGFGASETAGVRFGAIELNSSKEDVRITLSALGVITGKVVDQNGEPMRGVGIKALSSSVQDGLRQTRTERTVTTDDHGEYRMWDLPPGKYYLKAAGQSGGSLLFAIENAARLDVGDSFAPAYSGGGQTMNSTMPVEIGAATRATGDFRLKLEPAWRISGTLRNYSPRESVSLALVIAGEEVPVVPDRFNSNTGAFEFKDVVSGSYVLRAFQGDQSGEAAVSVAGTDAVGVILPLYAPVDMPVMVRFTNSAPPAPHGGLVGDSDDDEYRLVARDGCMVSLNAEQSNGSIRPPSIVFMRDNFLRKVSPGKYRISIHCFEGYVRSALAGVQDLVANPVLTIEPGSAPLSIEILATHGGGTIAGRIDSPILHSSRQIRLLLVPQFSSSTDPEVTDATSPPDGQQNTFNFFNLAPGSYTVYAFSDPDFEYRNPAFLQSLSGGQSIQIDGTSKKEINIDTVTP